MKGPGSLVNKQDLRKGLTDWLKAVFNSISVISWQRVHLSMLSWSSLNQYSTQYSFQATGCFSHNHCWNNRQQWERNKSCCNDYHQSSERISAEPRIEPATSCSQVLYTIDWAIRLSLRKGGCWFDSQLDQCLSKNWSYLSKQDYGPSPFITHFRHLKTRRKKLLKTLWEKEKMLVTSIFSFSHNIFYPIKESLHCCSYLNCCLQLLSIWTSTKYCHLVKG